MGWFYPFEPGYLTANRDNPPENLTSYFLPNGLNINNRAHDYSTYDSALPVLMTTLANLRPSDTLTFRSFTTLLFSLSVLRVPPSSFPEAATWPTANPTIQATECGLYLCVKEYSSKVENGDLVEVSTEVASVRSSESFQVNFNQEQNTIRYFGVSPAVDALYSNATYFPRTDLQIEVPSSIKSANGLRFVNVSQAGIDGISSFIMSNFDDSIFHDLVLPIDEGSNCTINNTPTKCGVLRNVSGMVVGNSSLDASPGATNFQPAVMQVIYNSQNLSNVFGNLAESLTNEMRRNANNKPFLIGSLGRPETVLEARWGWIALPVFCTVVSGVFFLISIWESHLSAVPLWKSNALAPLYHGLEPELQKSLEKNEFTSQMTEAAEEVTVHLSRSEDQGNHP